MPIVDHPTFTDPKDNDIKLWRYIDYTKFVSLLHTRSLFFAKGTVLKDIDPWEGSVFKKQLAFMLKEHLWL